MNSQRVRIKLKKIKFKYINELYNEFLKIFKKRKRGY